MTSYRHFLLILTTTLLPLVGSAFAQSAVAPSTETKTSLQGRHSQSVGFGLTYEAEADVTGARAEAFLGSLSYTCWMLPAWALEVSGTVHDTEATLGNATAVTSLLFGASYYPEALAFGTGIRPYLNAALGPYRRSVTGRISRTGISRTGTRTEAVLGARVSAGVDAFAWRWLRLGLRADYHAVPDRSEPISGLHDAGGARLTMQLGVAFGGRR